MVTSVKLILATRILQLLLLVNQSGYLSESGLHAVKNGQRVCTTVPFIVDLHFKDPTLRSLKSELVLSG